MTVQALLLQQEPHLRETMGRPPTPHWLDRFMDWALQGVPQAVQQLGGPLGIVVAASVLTLVIWKRRAIAGWWRRRSATFKSAVVAVVLVGMVAAIGSGAYVWDYVQHDNDFCNSCHVMQEPFERFQKSEHSELSCHDCHQQSMAASLRQVHLWVANRPEDIGEHAPVPSDVCATCHIVDDPDSTWQRISETAGHRVHLEADTGALKDVMCVTCHGQELHRFVPVDQTCGQSGCHESTKTQIVLGEMAGQTGFHCVLCHDFTAPVTEKAPLDSARAALVPGLENCSSCHEMEKVLAGLDPRIDPHNAVCGTCHNPHTQEAPDVAATRCAECHAPAASLTPFHRGLSAGVLENCIGCHESHSFLVKGSDCLACHADIIGGTPTVGPKAHPAERAEAPPLPPGHPAVADPPPAAANAAMPMFRLVDAVSDLRGSMAARAAAPPPGTDISRAILDLVQRQQQPQQPRFNHLSHKELRCTDCHSSRETHGQVTLESRAQCLECHHSRRVATAGCVRCHGPGKLAAPRPVPVAMTIRGQTRTRGIGFEHGKHTRLACATCHTQGISLGVDRTCASCHADHHTASADCTACHGRPAQSVHKIDVHTRGCAGSSCHEGARYGSMADGRNTCLACHVDKTDHRPGRACSACHRVSFAAAASPAPMAGGR